MAWDNNSGGDSPWGKRPGNKGGGAGGGGNQRPNPSQQDIDDLIANLLAKIKGMIPGGGSSSLGITALAIAGIILWLATGLYKVEPDEEGIELVFGKYYETNAPGLHYNYPAPIGEVLTPNVTVTNQTQVGYRARNTQSGQPTNQTVTEEGLMLTGDENIIEIKFSVFWRIKDARDFLFNIRSPEESVKYASEAAMRELVGEREFENIRTSGRAVLGNSMRVLLQNIMDDYNSGIEVLEVNLLAADPPSQVFAAFRDVQAARADKERTINEATAYSNEVTERVLGQAEQITQAAAAYRQEKISESEGDAQRFISVYDEYKLSKDITRRRIYLATMENIMGNMNKILIEDQEGKSGVVPYLPLDRLISDQNKGTKNAE